MSSTGLGAEKAIILSAMTQEETVTVSTIFLDNILNTCNTINAFIVLQYWR